jgi:hypothetical protein
MMEKDLRRISAIRLCQPPDLQEIRWTMEMSPYKPGRQLLESPPSMDSPPEVASTSERWKCSPTSLIPARGILRASQTWTAS